MKELDSQKAWKTLDAGLSEKGGMREQILFGCSGETSESHRALEMHSVKRQQIPEKVSLIIAGNENI